MEEATSSYRQIFKATSLFGGVQVFQILISVVRSKLVAVLIGPAGMGIFGLLNSTTGFISALTNFGLGSSAVKNVAAATAEQNKTRVSIVVSVLRKLVWITGLLGMLITIVLSPWLSKLTFGNKDYTLAFIWISVTLLLRQLSSGQMVVLQGLRKIDYLAKANVTGSLIGLVISVPLYYIWRIDGIIPVIIASSITSTLLSWFYAKKTDVRSVKVTMSETLTEGKDMLKMGFILSLSSLFSVGISYILKIYVSNVGGVEQVGLYTSGFTIINTYVGMIFTAMSTDYYPRLSAVATDNIKVRETVNQQAEIAILILAPILSVFLIFIDPVVVLFYSYRFVPVSGMIHWAAIGIYFKAATWSIGTVLIAKGESRLFFWSEFIGNIYILVFNIIGYRLAGLEGLGISFLVTFIIYFIQIFVIVRLKYAFSFNREFYKVAVFQLVLGIICFVVMKILSSPWAYILGSVFILIATLFSLKELEKRIGLKEISQLLIKKIRNRRFDNG